MNKDYLSWTWDEKLHVTVTIVVKNYVPTTIEDLYDIIQDLRIKSRSMIIEVDLIGVNPFWREFREVTRLVLDVYEYTKDDKLDLKIHFKNAGFWARSFYRGLSVVLPSHVRDIITFI